MLYQILFIFGSKRVILSQNILELFAFLQLVYNKNPICLTFLNRAITSDANIYFISQFEPFTLNTLMSLPLLWSFTDLEQTLIILNHFIERFLY